MRTLATRARAINQYNGLGNQLWDLAGNRPSLDLRFAEEKSLVDATTGTNLVDFTRASSGTYVGSDGLIKTATTNQPRFDHDPTTGESLGLLVEEQRVNYCLQSEAFDTSPWSASNVTVTANTETSPASTLTADTLAATSGNGTVTQPVTTTAVTMTFSVYLKRKTGTGNIDITANGTTWVTQTINSSTWTRCIVTQTAVAGTSNPGVRIVTSGDEVYAWGGQYELASFPSSYIPASGSTVTRAADVASISGANFSSWYRQDAGTVFVEGAVPVGVISSRALLSIDDGTNNERIQIRHNATTARTQLVADNGSVQFNAPLVTDSFPPGEYRKLAMAVKANDFAAVTNDAGAVATGTGTMPTPTQLQIGNAPSNPQPCKPIKRLTYWPARLPDGTLSTITQ